MFTRCDWFTLSAKRNFFINRWKIYFKISKFTLNVTIFPSRFRVKNVREPGMGREKWPGNRERDSRWNTRLGPHCYLAQPTVRVGLAKWATVTSYWRKRWITQCWQDRKATEKFRCGSLGHLPTWQRSFVRWQLYNTRFAFRPGAIIYFI